MLQSASIQCADSEVQVLAEVIPGCEIFGVVLFELGRLQHVVLRLYGVGMERGR